MSFKFCDKLSLYSTTVTELLLVDLYLLQPKHKRNIEVLFVCIIKCIVLQYQKYQNNPIHNRLSLNVLL